MRGLALIGLCIAGLLCGCGSGMGRAPLKTPVVSVPNPAPPAPAPPPPVPPAPPTPPAPPPAPQIIGQGFGAMLTVVNDAPVVAWNGPDGMTHVGDTTYVGRLEDLQAGVVLTAVIDPNDVKPTLLLLNGVQVASEIGSEPPVIAGANVAWIAGGVFVGGQEVPTTSGDIVGLAASGGEVAWVVETSGECDVYVDSILAARDTTGCPIGLKQEVLGEPGSSVWVSDSGGLPMRLSQPVKEGFAGAGDPAVASDGSVAWLDDAHGSVSGHFDVWLDGVDLSNMDDTIDEGPRLEVLSSGVRSVVWDDEKTVWMDEVPK